MRDYHRCQCETISIWAPGTTRSITETKEHELEAERPAAVERQGEEQCPELWLKLGRQWQLASAGVLAKWGLWAREGPVLDIEPTGWVCRRHLQTNSYETATSPSSTRFPD